MKFGVCVSPDKLSADLNCADYIELPFAAVCTMDEEAFSDLENRLDTLDVPVETMNLLLPGGVSLQDPADTERVLELIETGMQRAAGIGVQVVVFGSGGARRVPDGVFPEDGRARVALMARRIADIAQSYGVTVAMEPLNAAETNLLNFVSETVDFVREIDHPALKVLADYYHMAKGGENMDGIAKAGADLVHCHIAVPDGRVYPLPGRRTFEDFFTALNRIGYAGRVSIEGNTDDLKTELPAAIDYLRTEAEQYR